uniref:Neurotransmitter-gated ion-channel ligand-binding domain-containing protein n=1 Tax=Romanomermis culicivorax TaxID=13658 RepID=A0A915HFR3_ROMCU
MQIFPIFALSFENNNEDFSHDLLINDTNIISTNNKNISENARCHYQHAIQQFFEKLLEEYDNNLLPKSTGNKVELEVHVQEISEVSESRSSFVLDLFVSEIWTDERLAFDKRQVCRSNITIKTEFRSRIWSPGTCMINTKQATLHKSPSDNAFFIIYSTGTVWQNH